MLLTFSMRAHASYHIKVSHKNPLIHFAHFSEGVVSRA